MSFPTAAFCAGAAFNITSNNTNRVLRSGCARTTVSFRRGGRDVRASQTPPGDEGGDKSKDEGTDWDRSWQEYKTTSSKQRGGTFGIGEASGNTTSTTSSPKNGYETERRLADAWTSDNAFLLAAVVLSVVAVFYGVVIFREIR